MNINRFKTLLGYEKTLSPMKLAKAAETLSKNFRYTFLDDDLNEIGKEILTEAELIVYSLKEGLKPESYLEKLCSKCTALVCPENACVKGKTTYHMKAKKYGTVISKTGYDFALWLVSEDLTTYDSVQARINEEITAKEKAYQEELLATQRKIAEEEAERQAENEYKRWLDETVRNYGGINTPEGAKIIIQRDIFMDIIGEYNDRAKELLIMIDNIETPRCRRDIISRLHNGNVASIKTFEHITGIKLAKTNKERQIQLEKITKSDFAEQPKQYKSRKVAEQKEFDTPFYICNINRETQKPEFIHSFGRLWQYGGYDFYIQRDDKGLYKATEGKTGLRVAYGLSTLTAVYNAVKSVLEKYGANFDKTIAQNIERNGLSPLYKDKSAV